jgi:hypothetical protein
MMDNSYQALMSIFNDSNCSHVYYFADNGDFIEIAPSIRNEQRFFECLNPSNLPAGQPPPYELLSTFDEKSIRNQQISIKVVTIAHIYRIDYDYIVTISAANPVSATKRMSLFIQVSSTVVYTPLTHTVTITYAYDMQRTPIACIPDLPDPVAGGAFPIGPFQLLQAYMNSPYTICGTYKRVSSWGGFFAGKMMDYLFGNYFQAPSLFKLFINQLQVCPQYCMTALIYCVDVPPYSILEVPHSYTFAQCFMNYFRENSVAIDQYFFQRCLLRHSSQIRELSRCVTSHFMIDIDKDDIGSISSYVTSSSSQLSASCITSTTNSESSRQFSAFDTQDTEANKQSLCYFLIEDLEASQCSALDPLVLSQNLEGDDDDDGDDDDSSGDEGGPALPDIRENSSDSLDPVTPRPQLMQAPLPAPAPAPKLTAKRRIKPSSLLMRAAPVATGNMSDGSSSINSLSPEPVSASELTMNQVAVYPPASSMPEPAFPPASIKRKTRPPPTTTTNILPSPATLKELPLKNNNTTIRPTRKSKKVVIYGGRISRSYTYKNKGKGYKTFRKKKRNAKSSKRHPNKQTRRDRRGRK